MPIRQQVVALIISVALLVLTVELVRRRKLRASPGVFCPLGPHLDHDLRVRGVVRPAGRTLTRLIGAVLPTSSTSFGSFFFALILLVLVCAAVLGRSASPSSTTK